MVTTIFVRATTMMASAQEGDGICDGDNNGNSNRIIAATATSTRITMAVNAQGDGNNGVASASNRDGTVVGLAPMVVTATWWASTSMVMAQAT